ncbi:MAG: hypothetical protein ACAI25_08645 [Planctomycetota bacterium]
MKRLALVLLLAVAGCETPPVWDDAVPTIAPLGDVGSRPGVLIVRTGELGARDPESDLHHRGFRVLDECGHEVHRELPFQDDWGTVRLFPGRYLVVSFVGDGLFDRHWEKAQVILEAGKITAVDFVSHGPRELPTN